MTSNWALPKNVIQYAEQGAENFHIPWVDENDFASLKVKDGRFIKSSRDLLHIARDPKNDIVDKTYYLKCTNFEFTNLPGVLTGIEVKITMNRYGRVTDDYVNLCLDNTSIGDNFATLDLDPIKTYGSSTDIWNTNLTINDLLNSTFGIIIRFQSHPRWPHKSPILIDAIEIRVH